VQDLNGVGRNRVDGIFRDELCQVELERRVLEFGDEALIAE
jgi:hypothetical protein